MGKEKASLITEGRWEDGALITVLTPGTNTCGGVTVEMQISSGVEVLIDRASIQSAYGADFVTVTNPADPSNDRIQLKTAAAGGGTSRFNLNMRTGALDGSSSEYLSPDDTFTQAASDFVGWTGGIDFAAEGTATGDIMMFINGGASTVERRVDFNNDGTYDFAIISDFTFGGQVSCPSDTFFISGNPCAGTIVRYSLAGASVEVFLDRATLPFDFVKLSTPSSAEILTLQASGAGAPGATFDFTLVEKSLSLDATPGDYDAGDRYYTVVPDAMDWAGVTPGHEEFAASDATSGDVFMFFQSVDGAKMRGVDFNNDNADDLSLFSDSIGSSSVSCPASPGFSMSGDSCAGVQVFFQQNSNIIEMKLTSVTLPGSFILVSNPSSSNKVKLIRPGAAPGQVVLNHTLAARVVTLDAATTEYTASDDYTLVLPDAAAWLSQDYAAFDFPNDDIALYYSGNPNDRFRKINYGGTPDTVVVSIELTGDGAAIPFDITLKCEPDSGRIMFSSPDSCSGTSIMFAKSGGAVEVAFDTAFLPNGITVSADAAVSQNAVHLIEPTGGPAPTGNEFNFSLFTRPVALDATTNGYALSSDDYASVAPDAPSWDGTDLAALNSLEDAIQVYLESGPSTSERNIDFNHDGTPELRIKSIPFSDAEVFCIPESMIIFTGSSQVTSFAGCGGMSFGYSVSGNRVELALSIDQLTGVFNSNYVAITTPSSSNIINLLSAPEPGATFDFNLATKVVTIDGSLIEYEPSDDYTVGAIIPDPLKWFGTDFAAFYSTGDTIGIALAPTSIVIRRIDLNNDGTPELELRVDPVMSTVTCLPTSTQIFGSGTCAGVAITTATPPGALEVGIAKSQLPQDFVIMSNPASANKVKLSTAPAGPVPEFTHVLRKAPSLSLFGGQAQFIAPDDVYTDKDPANYFGTNFAAQDSTTNNIFIFWSAAIGFGDDKRSIDLDQNGAIDFEMVSTGSSINFLCNGAPYTGASCNGVRVSTVVTPANPEATIEIFFSDLQVIGSNFVSVKGGLATGFINLVPQEFAGVDIPFDLKVRANLVADGQGIEYSPAFDTYTVNDTESAFDGTNLAAFSLLVDKVFLFWDYSSSSQTARFIDIDNDALADIELSVNNGMNCLTDDGLTIIRTPLPNGANVTCKGKPVNAFTASPSFFTFEISIQDSIEPVRVSKSLLASSPSGPRKQGGTQFLLSKPAFNFFESFTFNPRVLQVVFTSAPSFLYTSADDYSQVLPADFGPYPGINRAVQRFSTSETVIFLGRGTTSEQTRYIDLDNDGFGDMQLTTSVLSAQAICLSQANRTMAFGIAESCGRLALERGVVLKVNVNNDIEAFITRESLTHNATIGVSNLIETVINLP